jgi:holliday junction DNA helicase RuvA
MIGRLVGELVHKSPEYLIVDVHGVGFRVQVSLNAFVALPDEGAQVKLAIHTLMRESSLELFGFVDATEKAVFTALLSVSGVGPRMALGILSGMPTSSLLEAIAERDIARLVSMPGVGKKTAERLVVELQDRLHPLRAQPMEASRAERTFEAEAVSALVNLGYKRSEAEHAVRALGADAGDDLAEFIRVALRRLSQ